MTSTTDPYCVDVRSSPAVSSGTHAVSPIREVCQTVHPPKTAAVSVAEAGPGSLAQASTARPANCRYPPKKQKAEREAQACVCRTSSTRVRDIFLGFRRWPESEESSQ